MRTVADRPFLWLVTRTMVPNGKERCAAVIPPGFSRSPLAVLVPLSVEYTDAKPPWRLGLAPSALASIALKERDSAIRMRVSRFERHGSPDILFDSRSMDYPDLRSHYCE